ncbi:flagellar basal body P-ring formation chaperone FlgA [Pantoea brenneri]|uniref:flagellar basal body P-ring formation chaperone FlgA n=1 Tax=Pantoea brenneri TaxID=472694 RepID=UPI0028991373|nr:flagellar basal body P-ring formation chaperone FlgA [Pantoea brenneri]
MATQYSVIIKIITLIALLTAADICSAAQADIQLTEAITALLNNNINLPPSVRPRLRVRLLTPRAQLATLCVSPVLTLSGNLSRLAGAHSIIAQCDARRHFIQIHLDVTATWWQASRLLRPGERVSRESIHPQRGSPEHLPSGLIYDPQRIIGRVTLRAIHPGENLVESQLRQRWAIVAGEKLEVSYQGDGFTVHAAAKALDNAALAQHLRVQTPTGQILTVTATGTGQAAVAVD